MPPKAKEKYTDPDLRQAVKEEIQAGDKGGAQANGPHAKAQMMAKEYKKRGGGYTTHKETGQSETQKHLTQWTEEEWQTKEGSWNAKQADGTEKRYLPKKSWEHMSQAEKEETEEKKLEGSKEGKQYVENTTKATKARKIASKEVAESHDKEGDEDDDDSQGEDGQCGDDGSEDEQSEAEHDEEEEEKTPSKPTQTGRKRSRAANSKIDEEPDTKKQKVKTGNSESKKEKDASNSKHNPAEDPAPAGSASRLPKKDQTIQWRYLRGYACGKVLEIAYEEKEVRGKMIKGSREHPRVVLESENGKVTVHKLEACFFEDE